MTSSSAPLLLSLSLANHANTQSATKSTDARVDERDWGRDFLDLLDEEEGDRLLLRGELANPTDESDFRDAGELSDWTRDLFASSPAPSYQDREGEEEEEVDWLSATRRKVIVMTIGSIREAHTEREDGGTVTEAVEMQGNDQGGRGKGERRVLLGCEDGSLIILASLPTADVSTTATTSPHLTPTLSPPITPSYQNSLATSTSNSSSPPATPSRRTFTPTKLILNGRPIIPPYSPPGSSTSTGGGRRISSASSFAPTISDLSSTTAAVVVGGGGGGAGGAGGGRTRKASATVGISVGQETNSNELSPSFPGSPTLSISGMGSAFFGGHGIGVGGGGDGGGGGKHRAKESITSGIGLWETEAIVDPSSSPENVDVDLGNDNLNSKESEFVTKNGSEIVTKNGSEIVTEEGRMEVRMRINLSGRGRIVGLEMVYGLRYAREEGGVVVVLRGDGNLSIHSILDGRSFGSIKVSSSLASSTSSSISTFIGIKTISLDGTSYALCYTSSGIVVVDLNNLTFQESVEIPLRIPPVVVVRDGMTSLIYSERREGSSDLFEREILLGVSGAEGSGDVGGVAGKAGGKSADDGRKPVEVRIGEARNLGSTPVLEGEILGIRATKGGLLAFNSKDLSLFALSSSSLTPLAHFALDCPIIDVKISPSNEIVLFTHSSIAQYTLVPSGIEGQYKFEKLWEETRGVGRVESSYLGEEGVYVVSTTAGERCLDVFSLRDDSSPDLVSLQDRNGESSRQPTPPEESTDRNAAPEKSTGRSNRLYSDPISRGWRSRITANVRLDREELIIGNSAGEIYSMGFDSTNSTIRGRLSAAISVVKIFDLLFSSSSFSDDDSNNGPASELIGTGPKSDPIQEGEGGTKGTRKIIVAGCTDGTAAAWDLSDWTLIARWSLFASPAESIIHLQIPSSNRLSNTLLFISANSPIALISLSSSTSHRIQTELLFILPGTASPVVSVSTDSKGGELLVIYENGLARVCAVEGMELRRSMRVEIARKVLEGKEWTTWFERGEQGSLGSESIFTLDLRTEIDAASQMLPWSASALPTTTTSSITPPRISTTDECDLTASTKNSREHLGLVRFLLAQVCPFGIDEDCDELLRGGLGIVSGATSLGVAVQSAGALSSMRCEEVYDSWTVSPAATAQRLLYIVCLLRVFLNFPDTERPASQAIAFYASFLADSVGSRFIFPSLDVFADYWLDRSNEVQQAARLLFGSYLASASDSTIVQLAERWQDSLPTRERANEMHHGSADQAVLIIGLIASEKFKLLSPTTLKEVSTSITSYLSSSLPHHQSIALSLLVLNFEIYQNYFDAMAIVRLLFGLATGKNSSTPVELRNLARAATVRVASVNTPLFITTLSLDIMGAKEVGERNATLKLLGFMVRKKPLVLYTSLPRLAEAVVKSLDPTVTALRETVQQAATVILNELVRTYPSIDFHGRSQRLAVGTHEGASIVYDLRTATRLYVLEGHQKPITALSWSPDGRRLVTVALEESKVVVWKVGVGILSMFSPGVPPSGGVPFKVLEFNVGDEGLMTTAATLEWVGFEWPTERTARLKIRETALTFNV